MQWTTTGFTSRVGWFLANHDDERRCSYTRHENKFFVLIKLSGQYACGFEGLRDKPFHELTPLDVTSEEEAKAAAEVIARLTYKEQV